MCFLLLTLPLFELDISEAEIVIETFGYVKSKKQCVPKEMFDKVVMGSYLNIVEYKPEELLGLLAWLKKLKMFCRCIKKK